MAADTEATPAHNMQAFMAANSMQLIMNRLQQLHQEPGETSTVINRNPDDAMRAALYAVKTQWDAVPAFDPEDAVRGLVHVLVRVPTSTFRHLLVSWLDVVMTLLLELDPLCMSAWVEATIRSLTLNVTKTAQFRNGVTVWLLDVLPHRHQGHDDDGAARLAQGVHSILRRLDGPQCNLLLTRWLNVRHPPAWVRQVCVLVVHTVAWWSHPALHAFFRLVWTDLVKTWTDTPDLLEALYRVSLEPALRSWQLAGAGGASFLQCVQTYVPVAERGRWLDDLHHPLHPLWTLDMIDRKPPRLGSGAAAGWKPRPAPRAALASTAVWAACASTMLSDTAIHQLVDQPRHRRDIYNTVLQVLATKVPTLTAPDMQAAFETAAHQWASRMLESPAPTWGIFVGPGTFADAANQHPIRLALQLIEFVTHNYAVLKDTCQGVYVGADGLARGLANAVQHMVVVDAFVATGRPLRRRLATLLDAHLPPRVHVIAPVVTTYIETVIHDMPPNAFGQWYTGRTVPVLLDALVHPVPSTTTWTRADYEQIHRQPSNDTAHRQARDVIAALAALQAQLPAPHAPLHLRHPLVWLDVVVDDDADNLTADLLRSNALAERCRDDLVA